MSRAHPPFAAGLCLFWHGIFEGKKQPVSFYAASSRAALRKEVEKAVARYGRDGDAASADRLTRLWELISLYIQAQNELPATGGRTPLFHPPASAFSDFLHLLYAGEKPDSFWRKFSRRYRLHAVPLLSFWDYFEDFQPRRMELGGWLAANAKGKILDLGSGAHSYIPVDTAADISTKALAENREVKKKVRIRPLDKMTAKSGPFSPLSFDTIMLNSVLSYVKNHARLLRFLHSALKPGGLLLITNAPIQPHHPAMFFVKHEVKAGGLARELRKAGFEVKDDSTGQLVRLIGRRRA